MQRLRDSLNVTDSVTVAFAKRRNLVDTITISEVLSYRLIPFEAMGDTVDVGEQVGLRLLPATPIVDRITIGELVTLNKVISLHLADCITVTDMLRRVITASASDTIHITEQLNKWMAIADRIIVTESVGTNIRFNALCGTTQVPDKSPIIDTIVISEVVKVVKVLHISLSDTVTPTDSVVLLP